MLFWSCCSVAEDLNANRLDIDPADCVVYYADESTAESPAVLPTLLASQPAQAIDAVKLTPIKEVEEEAEAHGPVEMNASSMQGTRCMLVSASTGAQTEVEYIVDAESRQLDVRMARQEGQLEMIVCPKIVGCPVASITDIYTIEDGEDCFPKSIMESLLVGEKMRLFMLVYATGDSSMETACLCLVEASKSARDELLQQLQDLSSCPEPLT